MFVATSSFETLQSSVAPELFTVVFLSQLFCWTLVKVSLPSDEASPLSLSPSPSRLKVCNSNRYAAVSRQDMSRMLQQKGQTKKQLFLCRFCVIVANSPSFTGSFTGFLQEWDTECAQDEETTPGLTLDLPRYSQHCQWVALSDLDPDTLTFPGGAPLQLHTVPPGLLPRIPHFYVCTRCGKVFWEGSHFDRVVSMFEEILHVSAPESAADQLQSRQT